MVERILITGTTGFVGSHLADYVVSLGPGYKVFGLKRWHLSRMDNIRHILDRITLVDCDITDPISTRTMIDKVRPDCIFHCAAESFVSPSWDNPHRYMQVNYHGTVNLLDAIHFYKLDCTFHIPGSGEEYGDVPVTDLPITPATILQPVNPYAVSKIAQDLIGYVYFRSYGTKVIRTRAFNHEGPRRDKVFGIPWYAYQIARIEAGQQEPLILTGEIDDRRNFTHVLDMVKAYWMATKKCTPGELYLVGSDSEDSIFTFRQAVEMLIEMSTTKGIRHQIDAQFVRPTAVPRLIADTTKFQNATGWRPQINFHTILVDTLDYWRKRVKDGTA